MAMVRGLEPRSAGLEVPLLSPIKPYHQKEDPTPLGLRDRHVNSGLVVWS